jgi:hypothetical protein
MEQFLFTMYLITQLLGVKHGTGKHRSELTAENNSKALMVCILCSLRPAPLLYTDHA